MSERSRLTVMKWNNVMPPARPACSAFIGACCGTDASRHPQSCAGSFFLSFFSHRACNCYALTTRDLRGGARTNGQVLLPFYFYYFFPIERVMSSILLSLNLWPATAARQKLWIALPPRKKSPSAINQKAMCQASNGEGEKGKRKRGGLGFGADTIGI